MYNWNDRTVESIPLNLRSTVQELFSRFKTLVLSVSILWIKNLNANTLCECEYLIKPADLVKAWCTLAASYPRNKIDARSGFRVLCYVVMLYCTKDCCSFILLELAVTCMLLVWMKTKRKFYPAFEHAVRPLLIMNSCWPFADRFVLSITRHGHAKLLNDVSPGEALLGGIRLSLIPLIRSTVIP